MIIKYKCRCMKDELELVVSDRVPGSPIGAWMEMVIQPSLTYDHQFRSPLCVASKMDFVKIPIPEDGGEVGVPVTKN